MKAITAIFANTRSFAKGGSIYSPKINEELIPVLYKIGKMEKKPMTRVVDELLRYALESREEYRSIYTDSENLWQIGQSSARVVDRNATPRR